VGLALYDPVVRVAGLLHSMMPLSHVNPEKATVQPATYTDTGAQTMLQEMFNLGATRQALVAKVIGASTHVDHGNMFRIGDRNRAVVRKVLWKNGILIAAEDVGGSVSRTVSLDVGTGRTFIKSEGGVREL
jgi:chemotaxis protein CheD